MCVHVCIMRVMTKYHVCCSTRYILFLTCLTTFNKLCVYVHIYRCSCYYLIAPIVWFEFSNGISIYKGLNSIKACAVQ